MEQLERIDLEAPLSGDFQAVVRLIVGGIAERVDFAFEEIDDLQLAVERLLAEAGTAGTLRLPFQVGADRGRTAVGPRGEALEDIEQVGAIGLIKAIDRFELEREVSLATYATPNVVGEIKRHFRDKGWAIRVPRALQELNAKMSSTIDHLTSKLGRSPSIAEIAESLGTTPEEVLEAIEVGSAYTTLSLSGPVGEDAADPLETIGDEDTGYERTEDRAALAPALARLPQRERDILRMRFEEGLPQ